MKNKKPTFKKTFIEFIKELGAAFILCAIFLALLLIGFIILWFLPKKIFDILIEVAPLIGFFTLLILLYVVSKIIEAVRKVKTNSTTAQGENRHEES